MMLWEIEEIKGLQITDFVLKDENLKEAPCIFFQSSAIRSILSLDMENHLNITMRRLSPAHGPKFSRNKTERRLSGNHRHEIAVEPEIIPFQRVSDCAIAEIAE